MSSKREVIPGLLGVADTDRCVDPGVAPAVSGRRNRDRLLLASIRKPETRGRQQLPSVIVRWCHVYCVVSHFNGPWRVYKDATETG